MKGRCLLHGIAVHALNTLGRDLKPLLKERKLSCLRRPCQRA